MPQIWQFGKKKNFDFDHSRVFSCLYFLFPKTILIISL